MMVIIAENVRRPRRSVKQIWRREDLLDKLHRFRPSRERHLILIVGQSVHQTFSMSSTIITVKADKIHLWVEGSLKKVLRSGGVIRWKVVHLRKLLHNCVIVVGQTGQVKLVVEGILQQGSIICLLLLIIKGKLLLLLLLPLKIILQVRSVRQRLVPITTMVAG